ncbi:MAG: Sec-independent protein translocase protein TatB [Haliea sp.]|jgi:sec-independent protein translocase protein TatB|nr:Sec-independent protein translocase protein TatB [Haliea sp.]MDP5063066.1 Sec-independent protein translocase protein TatB [Haliea sp.]
MFDIGFAELLLIGVVGLLVIGPERLPATIRTVSVWIQQIRRGFNQIRTEVEQELHNDEVLQELRKTGRDLRNDAQRVSDSVTTAAQKATATEPGPKPEREPRPLPKAEPESIAAESIGGEPPVR